MTASCNWVDLLQDTHTQTLTHLSPFPGPTQVSRYQRGKTSLDFTGARDSEWQWHQLGYTQVPAPSSRQITTSATHYSVFFTDRMPFLPPNQQRQSTEGVTLKALFQVSSVQML